MRQRDESYRTAQSLLGEIGKCTKEIDGPVRIMEVCGTHTVELRKAGIHSLLPSNLSLISGPGCPVCVTPGGYIDNALKLVQEENTLIATFGDMLKVPGSEGISLSRYMGSDNRVKMVYSPQELIPLAESMDIPVVFLGVGFETTIPTVASVFLKVAQKGIKNLFLYTAFKTVIPALKALLDAPDRYVDGFLLPGHVSVIIGSQAYNILSEPGGIPGVITGFEPLDMLWGILLLVRQLRQGRQIVENAYPRAVKSDGNPMARAVMNQLLVPSDDLWRGLGRIPGGGLSLKPEYSSLDAAEQYHLPEIELSDPPGCLCGEVIQGKNQPKDCQFFGKRCTPDIPIGPCMVSSEGTCAAYLKYGGS